MIYNKRHYSQNGETKLIEHKSIKRNKPIRENWTATTTYINSDEKQILKVDTFGINKPQLTEPQYNKYELANVEVFDHYFFLIKEHLSIQAGIPKSTYDLWAYDYNGKNLSEKTNLEYQALEKEKKTTKIKLNKKFNSSTEKTKE